MAVNTGLYWGICKPKWTSSFTPCLWVDSYDEMNGIMIIYKLCLAPPPSATVDFWVFMSIAPVFAMRLMNCTICQSLRSLYRARVTVEWISKPQKRRVLLYYISLLCSIPHATRKVCGSCRHRLCGLCCRLGNECGKVCCFYQSVYFSFWFGWGVQNCIGRLQHRRCVSCTNGAPSSKKLPPASNNNKDHEQNSSPYSTWLYFKDVWYWWWFRNLAKHSRLIACHCL